MTLKWVSTYPADADTIAYMQAVETADGQALELDVIKAYDAFILGCKHDGIWDAIKASCILAGARTLDGALVPLKGGAPSKFGTVSNWNYNRKTGLQGDGSTNYLNSNRNNNADPQDSNHNAIYISTANSADPAILMGDGTAQTAGNNRIVFTSGVNLHFDSRSGTNGSVTVHPVNPTGFVAHSRSSAGSALFRVANATTPYTMASNTPTSTNVHVFSRESGGVPTDARLSFYSIGESLDLALLDNRISTLMTTLDTVLP